MAAIIIDYNPATPTKRHIASTFFLSPTFIEYSCKLIPRNADKGKKGTLAICPCYKNSYV